jgi:hypothetical protein
MPFPACLFGARVRHGTQEAGTLVEILIAHRQSEVGDARLSVRIEKNVPRRQIAMADSSLMNVPYAPGSPVKKRTRRP